MNEADTIELNKTTEKRLNGKIIKISKDGYGFISSKDIPFTRIFFHWTSLQSNTVKFTDLKAGMKVSFISFEVEDKGFRAIKVQVEEFQGDEK